MLPFLVTACLVVAIQPWMERIPIKKKKKLDPIDLSRNNEFTIQNALFDAIEITKNANTSKYKYKGYCICFEESESFTHVRKKAILILLH